MISTSEMAGMVVALAALVVVLWALSRIRERFEWPAEWLRKILHVGTGLALLGVPWMFRSVASMVLFAAMGLALLAWLRRNRGAGFAVAIHGVDRRSCGELFFPVSAFLALVFARGEMMFYFVPILLLTLADAMAGLVGGWLGKTSRRFAAEGKTLEGSMAFWGTAFLVVLVCLTTLGGESPPRAALIAMGVASVTTWVEAWSGGGTDNFSVPVSGMVVLRLLMPLHTSLLMWIPVGMVTASLLWAAGRGVGGMARPTLVSWMLGAGSIVVLMER